MHDDPFARAVERVQAAEQAEAAQKRRRRKAQLSYGSRKGLRIHATIYLSVNMMLFAIWLTTWQLNDGTSYPWFVWPLMGWGVGLAAHYAAVRDHISSPADRSTSPVSGPAIDTAPTAPTAPAAPAPPVARSTADELSRLVELHRDGGLSDEEFSAAKAKLLS